MLGNLVNFGAIVIGSLLGLLFKKAIREEHKTALHKALGLAVIIIGLNGVITNMVTLVKNGDAFSGTLSSSGELLLIASLVIGTFVGSLLKIEDRFNGLAEKVETRFKMTGFAQGFVYSTILYCVGSMAILGGIQDGLGDPSILYTKAILDGINAVLLTSTMGIGVIFSSVVVFVYQLIFVLLGKFGLSNVLTGELMSQFSFVGYAIIMAIGLNFILTEKIKTANMLPSMLVPIIWHYLVILFNLIFPALA